MNRFPRILAATAAAVALTSSLALAAEPAPKPAAPAPAAHGMHAGRADMALAALSPEKQEVARALMAAHGQAMAPLHQGLYAKGAELEALNAAGEGESAKARAVIRDIADLNAKMLTENARFRAQMVKKAGLRTPVMGHGMMMGAMPSGKGMMGQGGMSCGMMGGGAGHAGHGAPAPANAANPAAPAAPASDPHAGHGA